MTLTRRTFTGLVTCSAFRLQAGQSDATFSTDVKVVNVLTTVRTKKGAIVRDLSKDDFTVTEDGRPQTIRYFSKETGLPLTLGLMVDTSMSQTRVLNEERAASFRFLDRVLRGPQDQVFIVQFDLAVMLKQPLTGSRRELEDALSQVDTPSRQELSMQRGGGTLLYDAVIEASREMAKRQQQGRKALIFLTDGVDTGSNATLAEAIDAAQRADTLIYSILFSDETYYGGFAGFGPNGHNVLVRLARETGGSFFEVGKKQKLEQIFDSIEEELRSQYSLGFVSDQPVRISEFRKLRVTTSQKTLLVQAREKYWAKR